MKNQGMRALATLVVIASASIAASPQLIKVESISPVKTNVTVQRAVISPDGKTAVVSSPDDTRLVCIDLAEGKTVATVAENGSINGLKFTSDSREVIYVEPTTDADHLRYKSVKRHNLIDGTTRPVTGPSRNHNAIAVRGNLVTTVTDSEIGRDLPANSRNRAKALKDADTEPVVYIYYGQLMLNKDGATRTLNPNGKEGMSYLWPSVSPDGSKILYYLGAVGAFVCDIDGGNPRYVGELRTPAWFGNDIIVGMHDADDGMVITSSEIIACDLNGNSQTLTDPDIIALYPTVSDDLGSISFTSAEGELYIIRTSN